MTEQRSAVLPKPSTRQDLKIEEQCYRQLSKVLAHWHDTEVRTVSGVMYQVRCGHDECDPRIEFQINWFVDCAETFIHNHRHSFDTYCLEGEYVETVWKIVDDGDGRITYQFRRNQDSTFDLDKTLPGALCPTQHRPHFPGNQLHVDTGHFHSIASLPGSRSRVLTFLIKKNYTPAPEMFVLSMSPTMEVVDHDIRPATGDERQSMYDKLQQVLSNSLRR